MVKLDTRQDKMTPEEQKLELESKRWTNRRKMAWGSFFFLIGLTGTIGAFLALASPERIAAAHTFEMTIVSILGVFAGIIMAYIGTAAYSEVRLK